jgi:hypothetical protein
MKINCDSQRTIFLAKNPTYHSKTKNIIVQYHFMRDMVERKKVLLDKVDTLENIAGCFTNSMSVVNFSRKWALFPWVSEQMFMFSCINKEYNKWENVGLFYSL